MIDCRLQTVLATHRAAPPGHLEDAEDLLLVEVLQKLWLSVLAPLQFLCSHSPAH